MHALVSSAVFWVLVFVVIVVVYMLPALIGLIRGAGGLALVFLVNLIGAPAGVGRLGAMILAFGPRPLAPAPLLPPRAPPVYWAAVAWPPSPPWRR